MEHRRYVRQNLSLVVELFVDDALLAVTHTKDVSRAGACVVNNGLVVRENQILMARFPNTKELKGQPVRSMVIHASDEHIGLMFGRDFPLDKVVST